MNVSAHLPLPSVAHRRLKRGDAFALVLTLLILSLLIVVAVSYLSSMVSERQTADAYTSKARAEQIAQSGVDSATAILTQSFRDYPDSATVWDVNQSTNDDASANNEGTSLYLRAVPDTNSPTLSATPAPGATPGPADDPAGNDPNNPSCKNFVLPLVSGVPNGRAQLVSQKSAILPVMNVSQTDPTKQNFTDLNVRRFSGDTQGVIGSPPVAVPAPNATPKPARARWVNLKTPAKDSSGNLVKDANGNPLEQVTGRYAFWIEDESFRANNSRFGSNTSRVDNTAQPTPDPSATPGGSTVARSLLPGDLTLVGPLTQAGDADPTDDAKAITDLRAGSYPGNFFPDPLAFAHALPTPAATPLPVVETIRYLTTNQSGTLNMTRHGTQRLNLNGVVYAQPANSPQTQVEQIVKTLKFHLPYFGERFYRLTTDASTSTLNNATQVPGSPKNSPYPSGVNNDNSEIYYYKVAANLIDYLDADTQPTIIDPMGIVRPPGKPTGPLNDGSANGEIWAQGKEAAPYLQEAAVRYRVKVSPYAASGSASTVPHNFDLRVDYYLEFWNMSDRDIYASPPTPGSKLPNLGGATILVTNQPTWEMTSPYGAFDCDGSNPKLLTYPPFMDYEVDLTNGVLLNGAGYALPGGVVFKAGTMTVVTTDPDCATYSFIPPTGQTTPSLTAWSSSVNKYATNPQTTYYCPNLIRGTRHYSGTNTITAGHKGIELKFRAPGYTYDYETEVTLCNASGILDSAPFALAAHYYATTWYSDTAPGYVEYGYSSGLVGNYADGNLSDVKTAIPPRISQLGDPRTNNEQLIPISIPSYAASPNFADQSHYFYGLGNDTTLGYTNVSQRPDSGTFPWPDFYVMPTGQYSTTTALSPAMTAVNSPMVVADGQLTSIGQLGDVFDPARLPGATGLIALSRGGGRTFKIGQRDDRYGGDPSVSYPNDKPGDAIPPSNAWAAWRLTDVFSIDDPIELPARININGVLRDNGAALLAALTGFQFQPATRTTPVESASNPVDPLIHGDAHNATSLQGSALNPTSTSNGYSQLLAQIRARLQNTTPTNPAGTNNPYVPSGPFFERGEFGELGNSNNAIFGMSDPLGAGQTNGSSTALVNGVDMYKTYDHSREELFRRIAELICTRGDTFTVYTVGQSISQPVANGAMKVTGTHRMRVTFRLVPINPDGSDYHPGYDNQLKPTNPSDVIASKRFLKPDHYNAQILSVNTF